LLVGSVYLGVMNQFGLGVPKNTVRAERYYQYALQADSKMDGSSTQQQGDKDMIGGAAGSNSHVDMGKNTDALEVLPAQLKMMVRSLLWMCSPATRLAMFSCFTGRVCLCALTL
jgi:hypothetical protein